MRNKSILCISWVLIAFTAYSQPEKKEIVVTDGLKLIPLKDNIYQHVSELTTTDFGKVKCNGLVYICEKDAIICDTPATEALSEDLLNWMAKNHPNVKIKAVIVNHFHADCLAGLRLFHRAGIKSYAHNLAPELLKIKKDSSQVPQHLFSKSLEIRVGNKKVVNYYAGEAHTRDNIVTWIPSERIIFGGCMVKSMNASKGNLEDANVKEWSNTIRKIKLKYPEASTIVPGHGDAGGQELLDYTIALFD